MDDDLMPGEWTDEEREVVRTPLRPLHYAHLYGDLVKVARRCGYALAVHGSMTRDLDLVAFPWTDDAVSAYELAETIRHEAGAAYSDHDPTAKPHGRLAWSLHLGGGPYLDLSVVPRSEAANQFDDFIRRSGEAAGT